jgi:DnaT-like ssDNA binding protein
MPFSYPTVLIHSIPYDVYGDEADADTYLVADITAANWNALTDTLTKPQCLVSATRWLDSVQWMGTKTDPNQALQFPRTGLTLNGLPVDPNSIPAQLAAACFELASDFVDDPEARVNLAQPLAKDYKAGSVGITYFRPLDVQILSPFPPTVMSLVGQWLQGQFQGPIAKGTKKKSQLEKPHDFSHGI